MQVCTLSDLERGQWAKVEAVEVSDSMGRRLRDLGLQTGELILCGATAPAGSPKAMEIRGAWIALRTADCKRIWVMPCDGHAD